MLISLRVEITAAKYSVSQDHIPVCELAVPETSETSKLK